jgi:menaquinone-dependent protoporphyrinogen oxidase
VLVVYASKYGSTKGVAERIATRLGERCCRVELRPVDQVGSLDAYEAFVRGSLSALQDTPVWLFSVGAFSDTKRLVGPLMKREPRGIGEFRRAIEPRDYRVFAGVIDRRQWPFFSRLFYRALGGRLGDYRDWQAIDAWADGIAAALESTAAVA